MSILEMIIRTVRVKLCNWHFNRWSHYESIINRDFGKRLINEWAQMRKDGDGE